jgi:hypothetical protein
MNDIAELLDPLILDRQRQALREQGLARFTDLLDETLAALAFLGRHPAKLRSATLAIIPTTPREDMHAYRLADRHDAQRVEWSLTQTGGEVAELLAATLPEPTEADELQAQDRYASLLAEAKKAIED